MAGGAGAGMPDLEDPRWEEAGKVEKLYMYPMKSSAPTSLSSAKVFA